MSVAVERKAPVMSLQASLCIDSSCFVWPTEPTFCPLPSLMGVYHTGSAYSIFGSTMDMYNRRMYFAGRPKEGLVSLFIAIVSLSDAAAVLFTCLCHRRSLSIITPNSRAECTHFITCPVHSR